MLQFKNILKWTALVGISVINVNTRANGIINGELEGSATAVLTIDGQELGVPIQRTEGGWVVPGGTTVGNDNGIVVFPQGVQFDPDPSITYGIAVTDLGAPSIFSFLFGTPIVPTGPGTAVASTIAGGLTDATDNGISVSPPVGTDLQKSQVGFPSVNMGVDIGPTFSAGSGTTGLPVSYTYGPYSEGLIAGPAGGPFSFLQVEVSFLFSGGNDVAAFTGSASIIEATTVPDNGAGMAGIAVIGALLAFGSRRPR